MSNSPRRRTCLLALLAAPFVALACGPWLPFSFLERGDAGLLAGPWRTFESSLRTLASGHVPFLAKPDLPPPDFDDHDELAPLTTRAELADLAAAGASPEVLAAHRLRREFLDGVYYLDRERRLAQIAANPFVADTTGLPEEFALYHQGALAWHREDHPAATQAFTALLELPPAQRHYKSTWAAYMLGRLAGQAHPDEARARFAQTRALAAEGFADSTGLAADSWGREAQLHYLVGDWLPALHLYLAQHQAGDSGALVSLHWTAREALYGHDPTSLAPLAADPRARTVINGYLLATHLSVNPEPAGAPLADSWLDHLAQLGLTDSTEAESLALIHYRRARFDQARRWVALAPPDLPGAIWLRAKLALRDGFTDQAADHLARLVRHPDLDAYRISYNDWNTWSALSAPAGELAVLLLGQAEFTDALRLFLLAGLWPDSAYVAERVLTTEELLAFVKSDIPVEATTRHRHHGTNLSDSLRHLLARRLAREGRHDEAHPYYPPAQQAHHATWQTLLATGRSPDQSASTRAEALTQAARLVRYEGLRLIGSELAPDYAIHGANFIGGPTGKSREAFTRHGVPVDEERSRYEASAITPVHRFHYRYHAADLAWEASQHHPDNAPALAALLIEAGGWLKNRDPQAADRFFKALVNRCPQTPQGREANRQNWFPPTP